MGWALGLPEPSGISFHTVALPVQVRGNAIVVRLVCVGAREPRRACHGSRIFPTLDTLGTPFRMQTSQEMLKEGVNLCRPFSRREPGIELCRVEEGLLGQLRVLERLLHVLGRVVLKSGAIVYVGSHLPQCRGEPGIRLALPDLREELAQGENEPEGLGSNGFACHVRRRNSFRNHEQVPSEGD